MKFLDHISIITSIPACLTGKPFLCRRFFGKAAAVILTFRRTNFIVPVTLLIDSELNVEHRYLFKIKRIYAGSGMPA